VCGDSGLLLKEEPKAEADFFVIYASEGNLTFSKIDYQVAISRSRFRYLK